MSANVVVLVAAVVVIVAAVAWFADVFVAAVVVIAGFAAGCVELGITQPGGLCFVPV